MANFTGTASYTHTLGVEINKSEVKPDNRVVLEGAGDVRLGRLP